MLQELEMAFSHGPTMKLVEGQALTPEEAHARASEIANNPDVFTMITYCGRRAVGVAWLRPWGHALQLSCLPMYEHGRHPIAFPHAMQQLIPTLVRDFDPVPIVAYTAASNTIANRVLRRLKYEPKTVDDVLVWNLSTGINSRV